MMESSTDVELHPRIAFLLEELSASRRALRALVDPIDDARLSQLPPDGGWSPLQILDHLVRVEDGISRMVRKLVRDALTAGLPEETAYETESIAAALAPFDVVGASRTIIAPAALRPATDAQRERALESLDETRARLTEWLRAGNGKAIGSLVAPHPIFGPMNLYQWGLFTAQHERRHTRQIARVLRG
jgi:hypothetical protein